MHRLPDQVPDQAPGRLPRARHRHPAAHAARLAEALRWEPCSPACANWLRYGIQPKNARTGLRPGACKGKAHRREYLGYAGRRVLTSRKWSGKTLADHRADRKNWLIEMLGLPATDPARYSWEPVEPGDRDTCPSGNGCCTLSPTGCTGSRRSTKLADEPKDVGGGFRQPGRRRDDGSARREPRCRSTAADGAGGGQGAGHLAEQGLRAACCRGARLCSHRWLAPDSRLGAGVLYFCASGSRKGGVMALRDGVTKRGSTWSYVVRIRDPETGMSKPRWVGGFPTEAAAKAARDEARVKARAGGYIDRSRITVGDYLDEWLEAHAMEIKPKTLQDYRHLITRHVKPHIGGVALQAIRPARLTRLYRDLATTGGRNGTGLSPRTVEYVHAILHKAFRDAVVVDQVLASNPAERAKRPRDARHELGEVWTPRQLQIFLQAAGDHRPFAFYHLAAYTGARRGELLNLRWEHVDLDRAEVRIAGSAAVIGGQRVEGTTKGGRSRMVSIDPGTVQVLRDHRERQVTERLTVGPQWRGDSDDYVFTSAWGEPVHPDTVSSLMPV